jgi:hypothetical protein
MEYQVQVDAGTSTLLQRVARRELVDLDQVPALAKAEGPIAD